MKLSTQKYFYVVWLSLLFSCTKNYLEIKPDQSLLVPTTLSDMRQILDNVEIMNTSTGLSSLATDEYELSSSTLNTFDSPAERNSYIWANDIFEQKTSSDWNRPYQQVFYANVVLDGLKSIQINAGNKSEFENIKGTAFFFRAFAFYQLADEFTNSYNSANPNLGIPIKLSSDVNERPGRGTVEKIYDQIFLDLNEAVKVLPEKQQVYLTRPSKLACYALMARISLAIGDYDKALIYSNECIKISPTLLDFNTLATSSTRPIAANGIELIFNQYMIDYSFGSSTALNISPKLVSFYTNNDLRKNIYLRDRGNGVNTFKGNYSGNRLIFTGLAIDEIYLIRAECKARANNLDGAMSDLNQLLLKRWDNKVTYPTISASSIEEAIKTIINERRKELLTRGTRWADLRRLNQDIKFAITLKRNIDGKEYLLPPNDVKYTFPIPQNEIDGSGIEQNKR
jgi:tetratricopeptide (TPR) repeat protein